MVRLRVNPRLDRLRADPRFVQLMERVGRTGDMMTARA
jgi:molybdenum-dependent DNA-binding transcriptional regulator ModE